MTEQLRPRPVVEDPRPVAFPTSQVRQLANGLTVRLFDLPGQHLIEAQLVMHTPLAAEPTTVEGSNALILETATDGTLTHPGPSLAEALDAQGAAVAGRITHSATMLSLTVPSTRFVAGMELFAEVAREAMLSDVDVQRNLAIRRSEISQELINPTHAVERAFKQAIFSPADRQYRPNGGSLANLAAISAELARERYRQLWRPEQSTLIIAGQLPGEIDAIIDRFFGAWQPTGLNLQTPVPAVNQGRKVLIVDRPDAPQAQLRIGGFGIDRRHPDWAAVQLGVQAIGGGFLSRVNRVLREELGYTYGAHVSVSPLTHGSTFALRGSFRTEIAADAIRTALSLLDVAADPLPEKDIVEARDYLLGVSPLHRQTAGQIATQAAALASVGLTPDWIDQSQQQIADLSAEQTNQALASMIRPQDCHVVIAGDAARLAPALADIGMPAELLTLVA